MEQQEATLIEQLVKLKGFIKVLPPETKELGWAKWLIEDALKKAKKP